ncbi:MAG TPA: hypothetical protein ENH29_02725 [Bacteroidetes bacterium]|nr:hypothetical protein [Bacteroidota bacterium]
MQLPEPLSHYFEIISFRTFSRDDLYVEWDNSYSEISPARAELEDHFWDLYIQRYPQVNLFNGILCHLREIPWNTVPFRLKLGPISFKSHLFSIKKGKHLTGAGDLSIPGLGVSAVVVSADKNIVFMKRSNHVAVDSGRFDVFGGHIDAEKHESLQKQGSLTPDPFVAIGRELSEEIDLKPEQIESLQGIGMITNQITGQYELIFLCRSAIPAEKIIARAQRAPDRNEYSHIIRMPDNPATLQSICLKYAKDFSPSGLGSLWLYSLLCG